MREKGAKQQMEMEFNNQSNSVSHFSLEYHHFIEREISNNGVLQLLPQHYPSSNSNL